MIDGLTSSKRSVVNYELAMNQHDAYVNALQECGLTVLVLPPDNDYPDSTFVEDTALLTPECAIIMRPGAPSRRGETEQIEAVVKEFYQIVERVEPPGTADAGDIMMVGDHYYVGLSTRTNYEGAQQIIKILQRHGMTGSVLQLRNMLHLKSGVSYLENFNMLVAGELRNHPELTKITQIQVEDDEQYAANSLWINGTVLVPTSFPKIESVIKSLGYRTLNLDTSEFRKLDGGLSCLSLRF